MMLWSLVHLHGILVRLKTKKVLFAIKMRWIGVSYKKIRYCVVSMTSIFSLSHIQTHAIMLLLVFCY